MNTRLACAAVVALSTACGSARRAESAPPTSPAKGTDEAPLAEHPRAEQAPRAPARGGAATPSPGSAPPPEPPGTTRSERRFAEPPAAAERDAAWDELLRTELSLSSSAGDCPTACRALESMRRARQRICELGPPDDPDGRCAAAGAKVENATRRVVSSCGTCA